MYIQAGAYPGGLIPGGPSDFGALEWSWKTSPSTPSPLRQFSAPEVFFPEALACAWMAPISSCWFTFPSMFSLSCPHPPFHFLSFSLFLTFFPFPSFWRFYRSGGGEVPPSLPSQRKAPARRCIDFTNSNTFHTFARVSTVSITALSWYINPGGTRYFKQFLLTSDSSYS